VTSLVILCIIAYTFLSGAGPAAQRACIMGIILVIAPRFGRVYNIYTAMALAVLIMCLFDPFELWNAGFQLSTIGTLGIVVLTPLIQRLFHPINRLPFAYLITEVVAITLAAEIATLPIFAFTFNQISLILDASSLAQELDSRLPFWQRSIDTVILTSPHRSARRYKSLPGWPGT
jgi:competence protein ComEC